MNIRFRLAGAPAVLLLMLFAGCAGGTSSPPPGASTPTENPTFTADPTPTADPTSTVTPSPSADGEVAATAPPAHAGNGPAPILPAPTAGGDVPEVAAADGILESARARLRTLGSFRFWTSIAGGGPAADGLVPGEPLVMAGTVDASGSADAAWSVTNPPGYARRTIEYRVIDGTVWCDSGVGFWTIFEGPDAELALNDVAAMQPPDFFAATFLMEEVELRGVSLDQIGAVPAIRFEAVQPELLPIQGWWFGMPGEVQRFTLWVAEDGTPLQSEVKGVVRVGDEVGEFRAVLQLDGLDDAANVIEPPI